MWRTTAPCWRSSGPSRRWIPPFGVHAENDALIHIEEQHLKAQGRKDITAYLDSRSEFQENEAVRRAIYLNSDPECCLIIVHASNPGAVDIINQAKAEGHNVHCETGPHYLALCKEDGPKIGPYMKFAPPAREKARTDILWQQLAGSKIDTIGSDHGGHTKENKEKGWAVNSVQDQAAALMEVAAGTSDAAVIDLLMAGAMIGPDTSYPNLTYTDSLTEEEYGIGCRQGSDLADFITEVLEDAYRDGTTQKLARQFGVREDLLVELPQTSYTQDAAGDVAYIQNKGALVVGITEFAPMDYKDDSGQWTGFDAELARLVAQRLGVEVEFVVIDWGQKVNELNSQAIDVVWNGMTLTDGVMSAMACTNAYCKNAQVVVVPAA